MTWDRRNVKAFDTYHRGGFRGRALGAIALPFENFVHKKIYVVES
jgi:hypothetical protein